MCLIQRLWIAGPSSPDDSHVDICYSLTAGIGDMRGTLAGFGSHRLFGL